MNLNDPAELRRFLKRHHIEAEKSLGQHFLASEAVALSIMDRVKDAASILEIGPGPGILTSQLAQWDRQLVAIELDSKMLPALEESAPYAEIIREDALKCSFDEILARLPESRAIVGNLPYYITAPLVNKIAESRAHFSRAVLMMQKEVADRFVAPPGSGDRGSISVFLQAGFEILTVVQVPPEAFMPPPKVKSTVLEFVPKSEAIPDEEGLFRLVKLGFAQPRKTLANNLSAGIHCDRGRFIEVLEELDMRPDIRPHVLTQQNWIDVRDRLAKF